MIQSSEVLLVCLGAAVGAPLRYLLSLAAATRPGFPWATLTVNLAGSAVLGLLVGLEVDDDALLLLGTGFCGALTTWSTFGAEAVGRWQDGERRTAVVYVTVSVVVGLGLAAATFTGGRALG